MNKILYMIFIIISLGTSLNSRDLEDIKKSGKLFHLGIPYANFVTGLGDGLDVELIKGFAKYLGVKYVYVETNWNDAFKDLRGKTTDNNLSNLENTDIKGDLIANGLTILPWRKKLVNFSKPTFPSTVWLIARSDSMLKPIKPSGDIEIDIKNVKSLLSTKNILTRPNTCLDASLYNLKDYNANILIHPSEKSIIEMIPFIINNDKHLTLLDAPDAFIAMEKWPNEIKIIGPISKDQQMGVAFRKDSPNLLKEFNKYYKTILEDGTYNKMVNKYYPAVFDYYKDFFINEKQ